MIEPRTEISPTEEIGDEALQKFDTYVKQKFLKEVSGLESPKICSIWTKQEFLKEVSGLESPRIYPIWTISTETHSIDLTRPLLLELEKEDTVYIFFNEETRILGTGKSKYEALEDFMNSFVEVHTSYTETPSGQLSEKAVEFLKYLESLIKR